MGFNLKKVALGCAFTAVALPALAQDMALMVGAQDFYDNPRIYGAAQMRRSVNALQDAGFSVFPGNGQTRQQQEQLVRDFTRRMDTAEHIVILLSGAVVSNGRDSWLLADNVDQVDGLNVGRSGLSIGELLDIAASKQGGALVMVAIDPLRASLSGGLKAGLGNLDIPQGVTVVSGTSVAVVDLISQGLLDGQTPIAQALENVPRGVVVDGFLPNAISFLPSTTPPAPVVDPLAGDNAYWEAVQAIGTIEAMETYFDKYPRGVHRRDVQRAIADLRANPEKQAKQAEDALHLNRETRREIQRNLSILGFDPRGVDGLFGRGSRAAIGAWQRSQGFDGFGYLTGNQITALQSQAAARSRQLEEEARLRQQEQDRLDAAYWRQTGRRGTEQGLRAYLSRYPDGIYADIAQRKVADYERQHRSQAEAVERRYWDNAQAAGTEEAYKDFIANFPNGVFYQSAKDKLKEIQQGAANQRLIEEAKADEARVAGNGITRLLVEQKLAQLGLEPGRVDGQFTDKTRRAVRKFQRSRNIPVTGYVTQQTIVRMLAAQ